MTRMQSDLLKYRCQWESQVYLGEHVAAHYLTRLGKHFLSECFHHFRRDIFRFFVFLATFCDISPDSANIFRGAPPRAGGRAGGREARGDCTPSLIEMIKTSKKPMLSF